MSMLRLIPALMVLFSALPGRAEVAIQEVTSPGGLTAWLVEEHGIPFTAMEIRFEGGTSLDLPGSRGATNLMAALLEDAPVILIRRALPRRGTRWRRSSAFLPGRIRSVYRRGF